MMSADPASPSSLPRVELYDTTLRDGTQGAGITLSLVDKLRIAQALDDMGFDYIEGGYPLSNPKDAAFFEEAAKLELRHARVCAFGMTRRKGIAAADDPGMKALVAARAPVITIVGKTWDLHVREVLGVTAEENLAMIRDSVAFCAAAEGVQDVFYDAEHFFDGYRANPDYAMETLRAAVEGGASRLVLCDTNGGSLPAFIAAGTADVAEKVASGQWPVASGDPANDRAPHSPLPAPSLAIHPHNDSGLAVANALAAVEAGATQVQGTINGIGERCGNVDLITVAADLQLKMGRACLTEEAMPRLRELSRLVYEQTAMTPFEGQPFVGDHAFAHKGGMHVHAVNKIAHSYEHVPPESVGNTRRVLVSELSGASNVAATLGAKYGITEDKALQRRVLERVQELEHQGYQFEHAEASFELLLHELRGERPRYWNLDHYRCVILRRADEAPATEAIVKLTVGNAVEHRVADGDGPVNALDGALRKALKDHYPQVERVHLVDYKVRVVNPTAESAAKVRVLSEFRVTPTETASADRGEAAHPHRFTTLGVDENIVNASWQAIADAFAYHLMECKVTAGG
jgi:2-isopropylmalate synthase